MCGVCGCGEAEVSVLNLETGEHVHADGTRHRHPQAHEHEHEPAHKHRHEHEHEHGRGRTHAHDHLHPQAPAGETVEVAARILAKNDALAARTRAWFAGREILALNLVSSPGSGKTTLLERTIGALRDRLALFVIEGDQATANDGARIRAAGAPAVQVNTGAGCHLEADMVARGLTELQPGPGSVVLIENVGNLVCPALFDLGERAKVVVFSVTEGEDKPLKYPHMFRAAEVVVLNKVDLLPHLDFDIEQAAENVRRINPGARLFRVSARTGEGLDAWCDWIEQEAVAARTFTLA